MKIHATSIMHLYVGCDVLRPDGKTILPIYGIQDSLVVHRENDELTYSGKNGCKLILRPLSDMTEDEKKMIVSTTGDEFFISVPNMSIYMNSSLFFLLLKQGFDLFGLIESGQAIDKTKLDK